MFWPSLSLFLCGTLLQVSMISSLSLLPWVEVYFLYDQGSYQIIAPVQLGLFFCFSDLCRQYNSPYFVPTASFSKSSSLFASPSPSSSSSTSIDSVLHRKQFVALEYPFYRASLIAFFLLFLSIMINFYGLFLFIHQACISSTYHYVLFEKCRFSFNLSNFLCCTAAVSYILITAPLLEGGMYLIGVWIILAAISIGISVSFTILSFEQNTSPLEGRRLYQQLSNEEVCWLLRAWCTDSFRAWCTVVPLYNPYLE